MASGPRRSFQSRCIRHSGAPTGTNLAVLDKTAGHSQACKQIKEIEKQGFVFQSSAHKAIGSITHALSGFAALLSGHMTSTELP